MGNGGFRRRYLKITLDNIESFLIRFKCCRKRWFPQAPKIKKITLDNAAKNLIRFKCCGKQKSATGSKNFQFAPVNGADRVSFAL